MNPIETTPQNTDTPAAHAYSASRERFVDDPRRKSTWWAGILSLMPGLGQVYVGYYRQGFQNILTVCFVLLMLVSNAMDGIEPPLAIFLAFFWLYNIVDAVRRASMYNQALAGLRQMDMPDELMSPIRVGSLGGGIAFVALGLILFTHTKLGWSLRWVADWWPLGLVAVGAWLIYSEVKGEFGTKGGFGGDDHA
jgi:hypothetical protein